MMQNTLSFLSFSPALTVLRLDADILAPKRHLWQSESASPRDKRSFLSEAEVD